MTNLTTSPSPTTLIGWLDEGTRLQRARDLAASAAALDAGLTLADPSIDGLALGEPDAGDANIRMQLHFRRANVAMDLGDLDGAELHYKLALRIDASLVAGWCNLGNVLQRRQRPADALPYYAEALQLDAGHAPTLLNLAQALIALEQWGMAKPLIADLLASRPTDAQVHTLMGKVHVGLEAFEDALRAFETAVELNPDDPEINYWLGSVRQSVGDEGNAEAAYAAAQRLQPLILKPGVKSPPDFTALALYAPFGGNTPTEYLFDAAPCDVNTYAVLRDQDHDIQMLRKSGDIVVNLISDADQAADILPDVALLADILAKPIINHPREIMATTREQVANRLAGLPHVRVPKSIRLAAGIEHDQETLAALLPSSLPVLARPAGTHGGDDFELIADFDALAAFIGEHDASDHYLIDYIDYQSLDGYFRKYRFIFVGGEIFPYHLAIGNSWKVHHVNTDMIHHAWMQDEEAAFLADPHGVFTPENYTGLAAIAGAFDLQYFGIDCGRDRDGRLVVFEVNASMLVHQKNADMPYKDAFVTRIKLAFDRLLTETARDRQVAAA